MENIKTQSTAYPQEQLTFEQWAKELRVGIAYNTSKFTDRASKMMNELDHQIMSKHIKNLKLS